MNLPLSKSQAPQLASSVLSFAPQSLTKSQTLVEGMHLLVVWHLTAHGFGEGVGVGSAKQKSLKR